MMILCEKVASLGFEPKQTESKSVVLPLHHEAMWLVPFGGGKIINLREMTSTNLKKMHFSDASQCSH